MGDVSEYIKSGFFDLYKNKIGKNYQQKTVRDRVSNFNNMRRETRNTLIFQKRQIDENMTPCTPETKVFKQTREKKQEKQPNKRLEMLQKWKEEKQKQKQEEKAKAKPLFKVYHVPVELGLPKLENVNKKIKGKTIRPNTSQSQSQFAPQNHKFHAPKTVKPININTSNNKAVKTKLNLVKINTKMDSPKKDTNYSSRTRENMSYINTRARTRQFEASKMKTTENKELHNTNVQKATSSSKTRSKTIKSNVPVQNVENRTEDVKSKLGNKAKHKRGEKGSPYANDEDEMVGETEKITNKEDRPSLRKNDKTKSSGITPSETIMKKNIEVDTCELGKVGNNLLKKSQNSEVKNVGWNKIEVIGNNGSTKDVNINTPKNFKKKYSKTPRRQKKLEVSDEESIRQCIDSTSENITSPITPKIVRSNKKQQKSKLESEIANSEEFEQSNTKSQSSSIGSATGSASPDYPIGKEFEETNTEFQTPKKSNILKDPVYISPFVTVSRGKTSARKEYYVRKSTGNVTPEFGVDILDSTSPKAGADYFTKKLNYEISRIEGVCTVWDNYKNSKEIPEEANDMIDVAIGQSKLLISKKFQQFRNLIEQCRKSEYDGKSITCEDLHGFWDMIYMQVEDLNKRFKNLDDLKANNWKEIVPEIKPVVKRGRGRPKKASASAALKNLIKAARNKKLELEEAEKSNLLRQPEDTKIFDGGYFAVTSPSLNTNVTPAKTGTVRRSLRVSVLTSQTKKRMSSPGLTMMKISQAIKYGDGLTPGKSILKNDLTKSEKRIAKSVLFKDNLEEDIDGNLMCTEEPDFKVLDRIDKENDINDLNLITFSPVMPSIRKSRRLSKMNN